MSLDDLAIAFAMRCDERALTYEAGLRAADELADELAQVAQDRLGIAPHGSSERRTAE